MQTLTRFLPFPLQISKILDGHEEEKTKIVSAYSDEINKRQAELQKVKETVSIFVDIRFAIQFAI